MLVITIDVEKEKWKSVDIRDRNSKGADIDIHEYCLALHYTSESRNWEMLVLSQLYPNVWRRLGMCQSKRARIYGRRQCVRMHSNKLNAYVGLEGNV